MVVGTTVEVEVTGFDDVLIDIFFWVLRALYFSQVSLLQPFVIAAFLLTPGLHTYDTSLCLLFFFPFYIDIAVFNMYNLQSFFRSLLGHVK